MKKYQVYQGKKTILGTGDDAFMGEFDTKKEAMKFFNKIKRDTTGWGFSWKSNFLETTLFKEDEIIENYRYYEEMKL